MARLFYASRGEGVRLGALKALVFGLFFVYHRVYFFILELSAFYYAVNVNS